MWNEYSYNKRRQVLDFSLVRCANPTLTAQGGFPNHSGECQRPATPVQCPERVPSARSANLVAVKLRRNKPSRQGTVRSRGPQRSFAFWAEEHTGHLIRRCARTHPSQRSRLGFLSASNRRPCSPATTARAEVHHVRSSALRLALGGFWRGSNSARFSRGKDRGGPRRKGPGCGNSH
jgi:hypothetical protein